MSTTTSTNPLLCNEETLGYDAKISTFNYQLSTINYQLSIISYQLWKHIRQLSLRFESLLYAGINQVGDSAETQGFMLAALNVTHYNLKYLNLLFQGFRFVVTKK